MQRKLSLLSFAIWFGMIYSAESRPELKLSELTKRDTEFKKNSLVPDTDCGKSVENKGSGNFVEAGEYPWTARIALNKPTRFTCEGTLINKRYVLTAGICIENSVLKKYGNLVNVRLGDYNCPPTNNNCEKNIIDVGVEKLLLHSNYGLNNSLLHDDIGLIRLDKDIAFNDKVSPICLPNPGEVSKPGDSVIEIGWNKNKEKLKAPITVVSKEQCNLSYSKLNINLTDSQLCAGGFTDNICPGISGGPLVRKRTDGNQSWLLEAIVSFGPLKCNDENFPNVYTKVESYLKWIHENVEN